MKVLLISGSHPRHQSVHSQILENFDICGMVVYEREELIPPPPEGIHQRDSNNFIRHFAERYETEKYYFGKSSYKQKYAGINRIDCNSPDEFNSVRVSQFVEKLNADICIIFGTCLIKEPLFSALPENKVNIHLGLSPWYKGSATLFWPFYNLQPNHAGATIHQIVAAADAGPIIHQSIPELKKGDGIHDVGAKTVIQASHDMIKLLKKFEEDGKFIEVMQKKIGRLYLSTQFRPEHLRVIYDLYENKMVDEFLNGNLTNPSPKLITSV